MSKCSAGLGRSPRKVDEQVYLLLEAIPPLSLVLAISTELAEKEEGGDHGLLHRVSLPGVLVLLTFSPRAAENDMKIFKRPQKFSKINKKISSATSAVLPRLTWYLTEELIPFSLFNKNLPLEERTTLAKKIGSLPPAELLLCKPKLLPIADDSTLTEFHWPSSVLLFDLIGSDQPEYTVTETAVRNLSSLNNSCNRALVLTTLVNGRMTRTESSYQ